MKKYLVLFIFAILFSRVNAQPVLEGDWSGALELMGTSLDIITHFTSENGNYTGKIDIPLQKQKGLPLTGIIYKYPKAYFELDVPNGLVKFDGAFVDDSIKGIFSQAGYEGTFYLVRGLSYTPDIKTDEIKESLPYKEEEVTFRNGDIKFTGTLSLPEYPGKHPAVVMITGSGPQDRNEAVAGFKVFKVIADHLTRNGYAVLRYDDRGVGGSTGTSVNDYTSEDFAGDVIEAVKYLKTRSDINPGAVGLFGHSEGGLVAPLAASKYEGIAFVICMAGTGVTGEEILIEQSKLIMKASYISPEEINKDILTLKTMLNAIRNNENLDNIKKTIKDERLKEYDKLPEVQKSRIKDKEEWAESFAKSYISAFTNTWMKFFITYDPAPALEKVKCPVLLLFGETDLQVPPAQSEKPMLDALKKGGNKDFESKIFIKANHLFQESDTGNPNDYPKLKKEFVNGFLDYISNWLLNRFSPSR
ncbi:MAG TPA: alpha/beta fold hydrolase [Ignavibacteria bacterium]|nr:alpha/beta fold hydrolase [Ignavibacteria bacterium]